jgi:nicotinate phosphoribosyltransferase
MSTMTAGNLESLYNTAKTNLEQKMLQLKSRPGIRFADFGQRRRHSFLWQQYAIRRAREIMGDRFTGTSNTWMAFNQDMVPIGTNAHELPMVLTAIAPDSVKKYAQYRVLQEWGKMFPHHALRIVLPDTYGSAQFWRDMPNDLGKEVAETWRGIRADSGDCIVEALNYAQWLKSQGLSNERILKEKIVIPSDGLDVTAKERCGSMIEIDKVLDGVIDHPFGWGTNLSNGFAGCHPRPDDRAVVNDVPLDLSNGDLFRGQSLVIKVDSANGNAAVKLSNNINKATGDLKDVEKYIKIFGSEGQVSQEVSV